MDADGLVVTLEREQELAERIEIATKYPIVQEEVMKTDIQDNSDWRDAYISFLSGLSSNSDLTGDFFYVDEDDIPEIIIKNSMGPAIYKYYQGNVVEEMKNTYGNLRGGFEYNKSISQLIDILKSGDDIPEGPVEIRELSSGQTANASEEDNIAAHKAYDLELTSAKNDLYYDGDPNEDYIEYAYADIDNDFIDELIVLVNKSYAAGCVSYIYDYNLVTGNTFLIFEGERDITIYNNGVIAAFSSDNHSLGLMWPYSLYCMGEYGEYEYETYAYSWDVEYGEYDNGESFLYDVDVDGNGIVYHLYDSYMDDTEFETWENDILLKEHRIELLFNTYE